MPNSTNHSVLGVLFQLFAECEGEQRRGVYVSVSFIYNFQVATSSPAFPYDYVQLELATAMQNLTGS
jgi:hypothetical protein